MDNPILRRDRGQQGNTDGGGGNNVMIERKMKVTA